MSAKPPLRVALYGNVCNFFYHIAAALREYTPVDAHLFVDVNSDLQRLPSSANPELCQHPPEWIHMGAYEPVGFWLWPRRSALLRQWQGFDAVMVCATGPMLVPFLACPSIFYATGGDLTWTPFPLSFLALYPRWRDKISMLVRGYWQRRGLRRVAEYWSQPIPLFEKPLARLNISPSRIGPYMPVPVDTRRWYRRAPSYPHVRRLREAWTGKFVLFHPTRMAIRNTGRLAEADCKHNDEILRGFARFIHEYSAADAMLVLIEREHSMDVALAKRLIAALSIETQVMWLRSENPQGFSQAEMAELYSCADVVLDSLSPFGGAFGSIGLEALASGCGLITYINESAVARMYPWHPALSAANELDVAAQLRGLYHAPERVRQLGDKGRTWIEEFHSYERLAPCYAERLHSLCCGSPGAC